MKKTLLLAGMLLAVASVAAAAPAGLNLGWGPYCPSNALSATDQADPCDGSTQAAGTVYQLVGSVSVGTSMSLVVSEDIFVDLQESSSSLSDYWRLEAMNQPGFINPPGCRGDDPAGSGNIGSLLIQAANATFGPAPGNFVGCVKFWGTSPFGGQNYYPMNLFPLQFNGAPNRARLSTKWAISPAKAYTALQQIGSFVGLLDTNHQVSDPLNPPAYVCAGCHDGVCIVFNECTVRQQAGAPGGDITVTNQATRQYVTWQGSAGTQCPGATPTHKATWGQVKSLYR